MATQVNLGGGNNTRTFDDNDYIITALDGDNTLTLGSGNDQLTLGSGNNTLTLAGGTDEITAGTGSNTITTTGSGADNISLTNGTNTIVVGDGPDLISAGDGPNTVATGNGDDIVVLGNGFDQVTTGNGASQITVGSSAGDTITAGNGSNTITIGDGSGDVVQTGSGHNTVSVSAAAVANDLIKGGFTTGDGSQNTLALTTAGLINASGVTGFEIYQLANGGSNNLTLTDANFARLPGGSITVEGGDSGSTVDASGLSAADAVIIHASPGANTLSGGAGDDTFYGASGTSIMDGGAGVNTMILPGPRSSYTVAVAGAITTVTGLNSVDTLTNIQQIDFTEPPPTVLGLDPASDSGTSNSDDITNVAAPIVTGTGAAGDTISLYDSNDNLIGPSSTFDDPLWVAFGTSPVVTPNIGPGPDGGASTADEVTLSSANSGLFYRTSPTGPSTFSVWVRLLGGNGNFALNYFQGSDNTAHTKPVIATGAWQQVSLTFTGDGNAQSNVAVFHDPTQATSGSFEFWGAQLLPAIGSTTVDVNGNWSTAVTTPLTEGANAITATESAVSGDVSAPSTPLNVTLDTVALAPTALALDPASDSGTSNSDDITNVAMPTINGNGENGATVTLFDGSTAIGTGIVTGGAWSIAASVPLLEGLNIITATQTDLAGNVSAASSALNVTLDSSEPPPTALALDPAEETGTSGGSVITNVAMPTITGNGANGDTVTLIDGSTPIGSGTVTDGLWSIAATVPILEGLNIITATETDVAGNISTPSSTLNVTLDTSPANFTILDTTTNDHYTAAGDAYTGPNTGVQNQFIDLTADSLNITSLVPNAFIHTGSGMDAIDVSQANGNNVLDGGAGSSFLTGGTGNDTFYLDNREPATSPVFSTFANFHSGDTATVWGVNATDFSMFTQDNEGAAGFTGLDFILTGPNQSPTSFVLPGYSSTDLTNGRLSESYGATADLAGVPGSQYLTVHAN